MDFAENKFEISVAALVLLMVYGMGTLLKNSWGNPALDSADVVYEMPRPKSFQGTGLDLSDREIDRRFVNPFEKKKAEAAAAAKAGVPAKVAAKAAEQAKKDAAAKAAAAKKSQVTARVVEKSNNGMAPSSDLTNKSNNSSYGGGGYNPQQAANNTNANNNEDDNKMSADQWRSLISAQPTQANMDKLIAAHKKGEIDEAGFYTIISDLFKSNKAENQALGLRGVQAFPNARSFVMVNQSDEHFTAELKTQSDAFLTSYGQASRVGALAGVLQSNDIESVTKATQIIITSYQQTSGGNSGGRPGRGEVNISSVSSYQKFIPLFQKLAQSGDSTLAALANSALSALAQNPTV